MVDSKHTGPYERRIYVTKVENIESVGPYCKTHDIKVPFCMPIFSISKITFHRYHFDNNEGES